MAEIDKGLPNTRTKLDIPSEEEIAEEVAVQEPEKGPIEVIPEEDGGVTLDFEPGAINVPGTESHFDNLADLLPDDVLEPIGNEMTQNYMDYKGSRKEWEQGYIQGLDLLGFKYENRTEPFQGAPGATHPEMADVKEGDELLVVNFRELQPPRPEEEIADRFKLDSPELHNLGDPLNKDLKDRIKELEEEDDGEGDVVVRR